MCLQMSDGAVQLNSAVVLSGDDLGMELTIEHMRFNMRHKNKTTQKDGSPCLPGIFEARLRSYLVERGATITSTGWHTQAYTRPVLLQLHTACFTTVAFTCRFVSQPVLLCNNDVQVLLILHELGSSGVTQPFGILKGLLLLPRDPHDAASMWTCFGGHGTSQMVAGQLLQSTCCMVKHRWQICLTSLDTGC